MTACTWYSNIITWRMHWRDFPSSHSTIVAAVDDGGSYSSTRRLWSAVYDNVFDLIEHSADRNSSSAVVDIWPRKVWRSTDLLKEFGWEVFYYPPYSPDIAPRHFQFFLQLKKFLSAQRQRFKNDREVEMSVKVAPIPGGRLLWYRIEKLFPRYDKRLISRGEYVENYRISGL